MKDSLSLSPTHSLPPRPPPSRNCAHCSGEWVPAPGGTASAKWMRWK